MKFTEEEKISWMGRCVTVLKVFKRETIRNEHRIPIRREWKAVSLNCPRGGWIVGFRSLQNGDYRGCSQLDEQPYLSGIKTIPCALVVFWPTMKPVKVPMDAFTPGGMPKSPHHRWPEKWKKDLSEESQLWPRDEKGRWKSC